MDVVVAYFKVLTAFEGRETGKPIGIEATCHTSLQSSGSSFHVSV